MSQESGDSDTATVEVLTYKVEEVDNSGNVSSTEGNISPTKPKKRKLSTRTSKIPRDNQHPLKTFVYCKSYYQRKMRSLFQYMNATSKLETRVLSMAGGTLPTDEQDEQKRSPYFSVCGKRFQTLANLQ